MDGGVLDGALIGYLPPDNIVTEEHVAKKQVFELCPRG